ncbi:hypothetical protein KP509_31G052100 [Ceratopteris richardii]|uniref:Uncharacterized protein n=1 Tax=Ceratopteris richardii TaxID=49495 RepID=A0A8T2R009_CERRI|nr:hypothetical protein KP509_31G052100 [Ceratopteris richardii]
MVESSIQKNVQRTAYFFVKRHLTKYHYYGQQLLVT